MEIEEELNRVWIEGKKEDLAPPPYLESEGPRSDEQAMLSNEQAIESESDSSEPEH
jgi:ATP-binding cassette subfamily D (ALD) long-chain fatty acid import protein